MHRYLDQALDAGARVQVEAHLAGCSACQAEVEALQALFFDLESLPDVALTRDLSPVVLASIQPYPISWRTGRWLVLAQVLVALIVIVFSWPLVVSQATDNPFQNYSLQVQSWLVRASETLTVTITTWSVQAKVFLDQATTLLPEPLGLPFVGINIWPWVAAIGLFWLLVNGLILGPTGESNRFNASNGQT